VACPNNPRALASSLDNDSTCPGLCNEQRLGRQRVRLTRPAASAALLALCLAACDGADQRGARGRVASDGSPGEAEIDFAVTHQRIAGFGASSAWTAKDLGDSLADQFFSVEDGIGLSLLRVRIAPTGDTEERMTARQAVARGAQVWAAPWTPPAEWKTNGSDTNGGSLKPEYYQSWADRLAVFARSMADAGMPLLGISAQNEPNWTAEWETCRWTEQELTEFIRDNLGPALEREGVATSIIAPETIGWDSIRAYGDRLLEDSAARAYVGAVATHSYGGTAFAYATPSEHEAQFWQTEMTDPGPVDTGMGSGMRVAKTIHEHLTVAGVNAWHYWWLLPSSTESNSPLAIDNQLTRRAYTLGNWSKFVRPGMTRIDATASPQSRVYVTAFRDPEGERFAIVAINEGRSDVSQTFVLSGATVSEVVPWVTSSSLALAEQPAVVLDGAAFSFSLPASSVTTFVGDVGSSSAGGGGSAGAGGSAGGAAGGSAGSPQVDVGGSAGS
jgi:glucuronoarabinoxylan endo-1,4-beta-xylanase